jgi:N-methylhydantoinase A
MTAASDDLGDVWRQLSDEAGTALQAQGAVGDPTLTRIAECRYAGQSHELRVDAGDGDVAAAFHRAHEEAYGYQMPDEQVQLVTARAVAEGEPVLAEPPCEWEHDTADERSRDVVIDGEQVTARVVSRGALRVGIELTGPALVEQSDTTTLLGAADTAHIDEHHNLIITFDDGQDG